MRFNFAFILGCMWIATGIIEYSFSRYDKENGGVAFIVTVIITIVYCMYKWEI